MLEKLDETAISDYDTWALYDTQYPVIYLNKYTITHPECFYYSCSHDADTKLSRSEQFFWCCVFSYFIFQMGLQNNTLSHILKLLKMSDQIEAAKMVDSQ